MGKFLELNKFFIECLNKNWKIKKKLNKNISNKSIEDLINNILNLSDDNLGIKLLGLWCWRFCFCYRFKKCERFSKKII